MPPFNIEFLDVVPGFIWFVIKVAFLLFVFLWIRATLPRYRYDQLMRIGWKFFLPLTLFWVVLVASAFDVDWEFAWVGYSYDKIYKILCSI